MVAIKNIILFISAVSAAAISRRTAATILSDIATIDADVKALTTAVDNYDGGFLDLLLVRSTESALETSTENAATDASNTSPLSSADSKSILVKINDLEPDINQALNALVGKKSTFASAGVGSTVKGDLQSLKEKTDTLGKALLAIFSSDVKPGLNEDLSTIDNSFANAEAQF